jgi:hypothetical protein
MHLIEKCCASCTTFVDWGPGTGAYCGHRCEPTGISELDTGIFIGSLGWNRFQFLSIKGAKPVSNISKQIPAEWLARHLRLATAHAFLQRETPPGIVWSLDLLSSSRLLIIHVLGLLDRGLRSVFNWVSLDNAPGQALGSPLSAPGNPWTKNMI